MKTLFVVLAILISAPSFAKIINFNGYITEAIYPQMIGLKCSLELKEAIPGMNDDFLSYIARPKIKDYSPLFSDRAPISKIKVYLDWIEAGVVLKGTGSRRLFDRSQTLHVFINNGEVQSWSYIDGQKDVDQYQYTCSK